MAENDKTVKFITNFLKNYSKRWDRDFLETIIEKAGKTRLEDINPLIESSLKALREGYTNSDNTEWVDTAIRKAATKNLKLSAEQQNYAFKNFTKREIGLLNKSKDPETLMEDLITRKYTQYFEKIQQHEQEANEKLAEITANNHLTANLITDEVNIPSPQTFKSFDLKAKQQMFEKTKDIYENEFKTEKKRNQHVRNNLNVNGGSSFQRVSDIEEELDELDKRFGQSKTQDNRIMRRRNALQKEIDIISNPDNILDKAYVGYQDKYIDRKRRNLIKDLKETFGMTNSEIRASRGLPNAAKKWKSGSFDYNTFAKENGFKYKNVSALKQNAERSKKIKSILSTSHSPQQAINKIRRNTNKILKKKKEKG